MSFGFSPAPERRLIRPGQPHRILTECGRSLRGARNDRYAVVLPTVEGELPFTLNWGPIIRTEKEVDPSAIGYYDGPPKNDGQSVSASPQDVIHYISVVRCLQSGDVTRLGILKASA